MGVYSAWILPRITDLIMRQQQMRPFRERIGQAAEGRVLDVGIGSGLNLAFDGARVDRVHGIDPSAEMLRFAEDRASGAAGRVDLLRGSSEALPFDDKSFDTVVVTFTLCTIAGAESALQEMRRVIRPGGRLLFAEHGRAPDPGVARWQDRLTPIWKRIAGGCHLNRQPDVLIRSAGFAIDALEVGYLKGPRPMTYVYEGRAHIV